MKIMIEMEMKTRNYCDDVRHYVLTKNDAVNGSMCDAIGAYTRELKQ